MANDAARPVRLALEIKEICTHVPDADTSLDIYELPKYELMVDKKKRIAKFHVGVKPSLKDSSIPERVLMVVGATGAGKTTLINGMMNYVLGVEWSDNFRFKLVVDEGGKSQTKSQTTWITAYTLPCFVEGKVNYHLTILDTPGFGDTSGIEKDREITSQIKDFFSIENGIDQIHGIGFVTQASSARLTHTQTYVFDSILSVFGQDIGENIFLMTTFADGKKPQVLAAVREAKIPFREPGFKFNNSVLFADNSQTEKDIDHSDDEEEDDTFDLMFWKMGMKSFRNFFKHFSRTSCKSLTLTREVLKEREHLETLIQGLQIRIKNAMGKIEELNQLKRELKKHEADIKDNKNFTYTTTKYVMTKHNIPGRRWYVTNCIICNFTCHESCVYANDSEKRYCSAMNGEYCGVCPGKCHWKNHCNNGYYFTVEEVTTIDTYDNLKKIYDTAKAGQSHAEAVVAGVEKDLQELRRQAFSMVLQAHSTLTRLEEIALKPNPLSQVDYIDLLISSEKKQAREGWNHRVNYYEEIRKQAEIMAGLKEMTPDSPFMAILEVDCVAVLIEAEKKEKKAGWEKRLKHYETLCAQLEEQRKKDSSSPKKWWDKIATFKFW